MFNNLINEFMLDNATASGTDWVITFPTKSFYVKNGTVTGTLVGYLPTFPLYTPAVRPFQQDFAPGGACDDVAFTLHDRDEPTPAFPSRTPAPPSVPPPDRLCWQTNVVAFKNSFGVTSNLMGSANLFQMNFLYSNGWGNLNFPSGVPSYPEAHVMTNSTSTVNGGPDGNATYVGLPVIGFMLQDFINGNVGIPPVLSAYGGNFNHKGTRLIVTGAGDFR
jgi:hypothetical protein